MDPGGLLVPITLGAALLALWAYVRWPAAAPRTFRGAVARALVAFALLQLGTLPLDAAAGASLELLVAAVVGTVVPVLTFAFLTSLWVMRVFADNLKGYV